MKSGALLILSRQLQCEDYHMHRCVMEKQQAMDSWFAVVSVCAYGKVGNCYGSVCKLVK